MLDPDPLGCADRGGAREEFARRYLPVVHAYLAARWRGGHLACDVEDAVQEVFLRCFQVSGPLERADEERPGGFQAYLHGICRNVARALESRRARDAARSPSTPPELDRVPGRGERLTVLFDRSFARELMREAGELQKTHNACLRSAWWPHRGTRDDTRHPRDS